jgi:hypothetical protein
MGLEAEDVAHTRGREEKERGGEEVAGDKG